MEQKIYSSKNDNVLIERWGNYSKGAFILQFEASAQRSGFTIRKKQKNKWFLLKLCCAIQNTKNKYTHIFS